MSAALSSAEDVSFDSQEWRLNNIYHIQDKEAQDVVFFWNESQEKYYRTAHLRDVILKARQRGFTTFIYLWMLDEVLFNNNFAAASIAHKLDEAKRLFREKIKYPYDRLPEALRGAMHEVADKSDELVFQHGSSLRVSTSARSGTVQFLHVSEMGSIAAHFPDKAKEIMTGAFEAVPMDGRIIVESTAEGNEGRFYDLCQRAMNLDKLGKVITPLDFRMHFHGWWADPEYTLTGYDVVVDQDHEEYFQRLETNHGIGLTAGQKAWWVKKAEVLQEAMKQEYPATADEAFEQSIEGAYYSKQMSVMRLQRRLGRFPWDPNWPVYTAWDLGLDDSMSIGCFQQVHGRYRFIDYYENSGEGLEHYARYLQAKPYIFERHYMPHDGRRRAVNSQEGERGPEQVKETAERLGLRPIQIVTRPRNSEELVNVQINVVRRFLALTEIDEEGCSGMVKCLDNYRKEWDERTSTFKRTPLHNWASHGADMVRTAAVGYVEQHEYAATELYPEVTADY